jgi:regulator of RNase E activity RraB
MPLIRILFKYEYAEWTTIWENVTSAPLSDDDDDDDNNNNNIHLMQMGCHPVASVQHTFG